MAFRAGHDRGNDRCKRYFVGFGVLKKRAFERPFTIAIKIDYNNKKGGGAVDGKKRYTETHRGDQHDH